MNRPFGESGASPLVGRSAELSLLRRLHAETKADGRGRCVLVTGAAGVGKSRLLSELRRTLRNAGEPIFEGRCRETDHRPYASMVELLAQAATALADLGRKAPATERALTLLAGLSVPGDLDASAPGDEQRLHFFEAVRAAVLELTAGAAPALVIHDLHRADIATLALLRYLLDNLLADPAFDSAGASVRARADAEFRALLVLTFREGEHTRPLLEVIRSSRAVEHLAMSGLDREGVRAFLQTDDVVERLVRATEGNPALLEQLIGSLPQEPEDFWTRRFATLEPRLRAALETMAIIARPVSPEQLRDLAGHDVASSSVLQSMVDLGLAQRQLDRGDVRLRFIASTAREAFVAQMPPARAVTLHRRIAERLVPLVGIGAEAEEVALHFLAAGDTADAVPFVLAAVDRLEAAFAHARAAELLVRVVDHTSGGLRNEVLDRLASLYLKAGESGRALETLTEALRTDRPEPERIDLEARVARVYLSVGAAEQALALLEARLGSEPAETPGLAWIGLAAEAAWAAGHAERAESLCALGERACERTPNGAALSERLAVRNTAGKVCLGAGRHEEARQVFSRNLEDATRAGIGPQRTRALINLGIVHLQVGEVDAATERFSAARDLASAAGELRHLGLALDNLAVLFHKRQDFARALDLYDQSGDVFRKLGNQGQTAHTALNLAELYLTVGDAPRAERLVDIARGHLRRGRWRALEAQCLALEGELAAQRGDDARAEALLDESLSALEAIGAGPAELLGVLLVTVRVRLRMAQAPQADTLLSRADTLAREPQGHTARARLDVTRAERAVHGADLDAAGAHASAALDAAEVFGDRESRWRAYFVLGQVAWARQDRPATLQALADAVEVIDGVAASLPAPLRETYLELDARKQVRHALRRVRAGLEPPNSRLQAGDLPSVERPARDVRWQPLWAERYPQLVGRAPSLFGVFNALDRVAGSDAIVLIRGESGTGKELVAAALHANGPRASGPFVKVNCSAFVETLLLSELFGHEKGAFTGAALRKKGRFELADAGTIFLDEIGDVSANTQVALLRVLQEGTIERVGGAETLNVDVRVLCATHRNLEEMVRRGEFRADLYYRLRGVIIEIPPLRDRRGDIPLLVERFLAKRPQADRRALRMSAEALASLTLHDWPGNVRELENVVRSAALFADSDVIGLSELRELGPFFQTPDEQALLAVQELLAQAHADADAASPRPVSEPPAPPFIDAVNQLEHGESPLLAAPTRSTDGRPDVFEDDWLERAIESEGGLAELKKRIEFEAVQRALRASGGNITRAAERLGMKRPRLSQIIHAMPELSDLLREVGEG